MEQFVLANTNKQTHRDSYDFLGVIGDVGGIMQVILSVAVVILTPYTVMKFRIEAIQELCIIKQADQLHKLSFFEELKQLTNIKPNQLFKRLLKKGAPMMA